MINNNSPLETLAAFAIVFVAGVVSTAGLGTYISGLRRKAAAQGGNSGHPPSRPLTMQIRHAPGHLLPRVLTDGLAN